MTIGAAELKARLLEWLRAAAAEDWIDEKEIRRLSSLEARGAEALFEADRGRPLTVGLFGGTGVGKSSLLNRLVGDTVAAVGLERPTSTEVTLYVHRQYPLKRLGEVLPLDRVRVLEHGRDEYRDVVWIDMPDIDSIERANRELVFEWLPYIDWLVYVVSPERYRDDAGWRVLGERGYRHHWMFVMNRLDTGTGAELDDFRGLLEREGFGESPVLGTSCKGTGHDDFADLSRIVGRAVAEHGLERLQEVGERARLLDLQRECDRYVDMLGDSGRWRRFIAHGTSQVDDRLASLNRYLEDKAAVEAAQVPNRRAANAAPTEPGPGLVADYVQDLQSEIAVSADDLPAGPILSRTRAALSTLAERAAAAFREGFADGAARPGNAAQRFAVAFLRKLVLGLPLLAGAGMAWIVLVRYQRGLSGTESFFGVDFLIHSLMVLGLAALLPYLLARLLRPSLRRSIVKRVRARLEGLRSEATEQWAAAMEELAARAGELRTSLAAIRKDIADNRG